VASLTRQQTLHWLQLKLNYDLQSVGQSVEPTTRYLISVWQLRVSWCVAPSLTRGRVCNLLVQLLLGLARAVTLGSKSRRTHDHILLSHLTLPQPGGPGPCIYMPQEQGGPVIPQYVKECTRVYLMWKYARMFTKVRRTRLATVYFIAWITPSQSWPCCRLQTELFQLLSGIRLQWRNGFCTALMLFQFLACTPQTGKSGNLCAK
jgi:hypothetical protein